MSFETALAFVLKEEGGYVDNPNDNGGATNKGITQKVFDSYRYGLGLPYLPVKDISDAAVSAIYRSQYWNHVHGDKLPDPVDLVVFDAAVNCGVSRSVKWLQQLCGTAQDGVMGQQTEAALSAHDPVQLCKELLDRRDDYYHELVDLKPSQAVFLKGWLNRTGVLRGMLK